MSHAGDGLWDWGIEEGELNADWADQVDFPGSFQVNQTGRQVVLTKPTVIARI
jgi:hypothetical protein